MKRGSILIWIVLLIVGLFLLIGSVFAVATFRFGAGKLAKGGSGGFGGGCYISDAAFTDTSISDRPDEVISLLKGKYGERIPKIENEIREVLSVGKEKGLNAAVVLSMWNGESSFRSDILHKAFGYGNTDSGIISGTQTWAAQLKGIYSRLEKARDNSSPYNNPAGELMLTRLWYNYTTALAEAYRVAGNRWVEGTPATVKGRLYKDPVGDRMVVLRLLVPDQVQCEALVAAAGGSGISTCPGVTQRMLTRADIKNARTGVPKVIILHYLAGSPNKIITINEAYNYFNRAGNIYVHYLISHQGEITQIFPDNRIARGALNYNDTTKDYGPGTISINIENEGHFGHPDKRHHETPAQVQANVKLVKCLMNTYSIPLENLQIRATSHRAEEFYNVISHQEADRRAGNESGRRFDPGKRFMQKVISQL